MSSIRILLQEDKVSVVNSEETSAIVYVSTGLEGPPGTMGIDGISVESATISDGNLILTMTDSSTINAGTIAVNSHASLSNIQGGTVGEHFHLNSTSLSWLGQDLRTTASPTFATIYTNVDGIPLSGFRDKTSSTMYISGTTLFNIAPIGSNFDYFDTGIRYNKTATISVSLSSTVGLKIIVFSGPTLTEMATIQDPIPVLCAAVYWNKEETWILEERHGVIMDTDTHTYLHNTRGSVINPSDFGIIYNLAATAGTTLSATISMAVGKLRDEDNVISVTDGFDGWYGQTLSPTSYIPVIYQRGTSSTLGWFRSPGTEFPATIGTSDRICYNQPVASGWTLTPVTNNSHVAVWIAATNIAGSPIIAIPGQREDTTQANAIANNTLASLNLTGLPTPEFKMLYRLIYRYSSTYANRIKADLVDVIDFRNSGSAPSGVIQTMSHNTLAGRSDADAHPASAISAGTTLSTVNLYDSRVAGMSGIVASLTPAANSTTTLSYLNQDFIQLNLSNISFGSVATLSVTNVPSGLAALSLALIVGATLGTFYFPVTSTGTTVPAVSKTTIYNGMSINNGTNWLWSKLGEY